MKPLCAALAAGLLMWPMAAHAQGYPGVMSPQDGYNPPAAHASPAASSSGGGMQQSPYSGTGASGNTGYTSMMNGDMADQKVDTAMQDPAPENADPSTLRTGSAFQRFYQSKPRDDMEDAEDQGGSSIYDDVDNSTLSPAERHRRAVMKKINKDEADAQHQIDLSNQSRDAEIRAMVQQTVKDQWMKDHPDASEDDYEAAQPQAADQTDDAGSQ